MKVQLLRKTIAGITVALGVCWLVVVIYFPLRKFLSDDVEGISAVFLFTMLPFMSIPGVLAIVNGIKLYQSTALAPLKVMVGLLALFGGLEISMGLKAISGELIPQRVGEGLFLFVGILMVMPAYVVLVRYVSRKLEMERPEPRSLIGRGALVLTAWQMVLVLFNVFSAYSPKEDGYADVPAGPWSFLNLLVPVLVTYGAYRFAAAKLLPPERKSGFTLGSSKITSAKSTSDVGSPDKA